jgi:hypothetical protein
MLRKGNVIIVLVIHERKEGRVSAHIKAKNDKISAKNDLCLKEILQTTLKTVF